MVRAAAAPEGRACPGLELDRGDVCYLMSTALGLLVALQKWARAPAANSSSSA
jgi:hypothetical protein